MIFSYCEGDTTLKEAASPEEFATELREIDAWNRANGYGPARIDPVSSSPKAMARCRDLCVIAISVRNEVSA